MPSTDTQVTFWTLPTRTFVTVAYIDGNGVLCQNVFDDDETAADEFTEQLDELNAVYVVSKFDVY